MTTSAAIYCRISRDAEGKQVGVENQEATCRELAEALGLEVSRVYVDNDRGASSLSKKKRPEFDAMVAAAERGEFGVILAYSMSRITRRPSEWETLITLAQKHGIEFAYKVSPRYDLNTADGRATARTVAAWDAAEAERTGERVQHNQAAKLAKGLDLGGSRPFGFEANRTELRESEAKWVREAYRKVLDEHEAVYAVAKWLSEEGVATTGTAKLWTPRAVRALLLRPRNAGVLIVNGVEHPTDALPAIVSRDEWEAMTALLNNSDRKPKRGPRAVHLLSGIAKCGVCGYTLAHTVSRKGKKSEGARAYAVYRCSNNQPVGRGTHPTMRDAALEDAVVTALLDLIAKGKGKTPDSDTTVKLRALNGRLNEIADEKAQATALGLLPGANLATVGARLADLEAEREAKESERDAILSDTATGAAFDDFREYVRANVGDRGWGYMVARNAAWELWQSYDLERRRSILRGFDVRLHPATAPERVSVHRR